MEKYDLKKTEGRIIQGKMLKGKSFIDNRPATSHLSNLVAAIGNNPIQRVMQYGDINKLESIEGTTHWHFAYDDDLINSLHVTVCDTAHYDARNWASRKGYNPTSTTNGTWSKDWVNNHGRTPDWALELVNSRDHTTPAVTNFHANSKITKLLHDAFIPKPLKMTNPDEFPSLSSIKPSPKG